jgi:hypothetical protein
MRGASERSRSAWTAGALALAAILGLVAPAAAHDPEYTSQFAHRRCAWTLAPDANPLFPLRPGYQLVLEGEEEDDGEIVEVRVEITVLPFVKWIRFTPPGGTTPVTVATRVVREREWVDDELVEVSRNWFAICRQTSDLFYFGEFVDNYEDGEVVDHGGSWIAGKNGALPGLLMPGRFLIGSRYYQELAPGAALDRGENVDMGLTVETEAGTFHNCVEVLDTNALEPDAEGDVKQYCPGVGLVRDEDLLLVERGFL